MKNSQNGREQSRSWEQLHLRECKGTEASGNLSSRRARSVHPKVQATHAGGRRAWAMIFDRQRVLLELLDALNEPVGSTDFQKLLFLYTREGEPTPSYDFVPYRFGCFSFTSYADKRRLMEQGLIEEDEQSWKLTNKGRRAA